MFRPMLAMAAIAILSLNATAQLTPYCDPGAGGVIACPCVNPPSGAAEGCDNFGLPVGGAVISGTGVAVAAVTTTQTVDVTGLNPLATFCVLFRGTAALPAGAAFGAGVRCVGGQLRRIFRGAAAAGAISFPNTATDMWTASGSPVATTTLYYFVAYRNPAAAGPCGSASATFNCSNSGSITW
jgi:hypothetical protein